MGSVTKHLIALFVLSMVAPASATTIVIIRTPNLIVIVADSKAQYQGAQGSPQVCKLGRQNDTYFAMAGLVHDTEHGFLANRTIGSAIASANTFEEQVNAVEASLMKALENELTLLRTDDPDGFKFAAGGESPSSIALAAVEGGIPKLAVISYVLDKASGKLSVRRNSCPGTCTSESAIIELGHAMSLEEVQKITGSPTYVARKVVETQIIRDPQNVGPPIEVLEIRARGAEWIQDELNCAAETNLQKKYPHSVTVQF